MVEESPIKEKHPPIVESSSVKQNEKQPNGTSNTIPVSTTPMASNTNAVKDSTPRVGVKRTLAQSFDEIEQSPAKRQRLEDTVKISGSAEIPANVAKKSCLSPAKHARSEPKQKTLHQVRFMLPSKSIVKPHESSEPDTSVKKNSSSSENSAQHSKEISSSESDRAPRPSLKKAAPSKKSRYQARYVGSKRANTPQKKSFSKPQSLISVILESSDSESEEDSNSEEKDLTKSHDNKSTKRTARGGNEEDESDNEDSDEQKRNKPCIKSKGTVISKRTDNSEVSESDDDCSRSDRSSSHSDSDDSRSGSDSEYSRRSDSGSDSTVEGKRNDKSVQTTKTTSKGCKLRTNIIFYLIISQLSLRSPLIKLSKRVPRPKIPLRIMPQCTEKHLLIFCAKKQKQTKRLCNEYHQLKIQR